MLDLSGGGGGNNPSGASQSLPQVFIDTGLVKKVNTLFPHLSFTISSTALHKLVY